MNKPSEYICHIDGGVRPELDTTWTLQSPDLTVWGLTVATDGIITVTSGVTDIGIRFTLAENGNLWLLSISDTGILSITSDATPLAPGFFVTALQDPSTVIWALLVNFAQELTITTEAILENFYYYPAIHLSFEVSTVTDQFELYAVKPNTALHRH